MKNVPIANILPPPARDALIVAAQEPRETREAAIRATETLIKLQYPQYFKLEKFV